jgi:hypothetical protein
MWLGNKIEKKKKKKRVKHDAKEEEGGKTESTSRGAR